jgi:competence protein ComEC
VSRPLALAAGAFAAACALSVYLPIKYGFAVTAASLVLRILTQLFGRQWRRHISIVVAALAAGLIWCALFGYIPKPDLSWLLYYPAKVAEAVGDSINRVFPVRLAPFIRAITVGDAHELTHTPAVYTPLGISGIAHIVSVSGMHVSFLVSMLSFVIRSRRLRIAVALPLLVFFMAVTGFSPPVCRAVIMQIFVIAAPFARRRSDGVTSVFAALLLILLFDPNLIAKVSLQLSFLSTLGIIVITPRINAATAEKFGGNPVSRFLSASLATTIGALVFSTPLLAHYFGYVSLVAPITNIVTLWAAAFCFCGGLIAGILGLISVSVGSAAALVAGLPADWIILAARWLSKIPFAAVYVSNTYILAWLVYVYAVFAAFFLLRGKLRKVIYPVCGTVLALCLALLLTSLSPKGGLRVTALDVGQGQSIVLSDGDASAVIDCGGTGFDSPAFVAAGYLQSETTPPVDLLILTHFHTDHAGRVVELMSRVRVDTLIIPDPDLGGREPLADEILDYANALKTDIIIVTDVLQFNFGDSELTIFPPFEGYDENEVGLTILVSDGPWDALITGDMRSGTELLLLEDYELPDIELLIAGHHGSKYSNSEDFLDEVRPETAIISVGARNAYGHPAPETLERFAERGITVYRTDILGNITVKAG